MPLPHSLKNALDLPLIAAPMFLVSGPELVIAEARAGVMGTFPTTNARDLSTLELWLDQITGALKTARDQGERVGPWAANLVVHRSNNRLPEDMALIKRYQPPVVITALGGPQAVIKDVHAYGGLVFADVNSLAFARKAVTAGADGLILVGAGAGGHTGMMNGLSFLAGVRDFFSGPVALGGGLANGASIRAVEVAGADLANMGTAFIATEESLASSHYRDMLVRSTVEDLVLSDAVTGVHAYWLRESMLAAGLDPDHLRKDFETDFSSGTDESRKNVDQRVRWSRVWSAGHGVETIRKVESVATLVERLKREYDVAVQRPALRLSP